MTILFCSIKSDLPAANGGECITFRSITAKSRSNPVKLPDGMLGPIKNKMNFGKIAPSSKSFCEHKPVYFVISYEKK